MVQNKKAAIEGIYRVLKSLASERGVISFAAAIEESVAPGSFKLLVYAAWPDVGTSEIPRIIEDKLRRMSMPAHLRVSEVELLTRDDARIALYSPLEENADWNGDFSGLELLDCHLFHF